MRDNSGLYIIGIISTVALVAVIIIVSGREESICNRSDVIGQVIQIVPNEEHALPTCEDSDGGENYYERGIVTYTQGSLSTTPYERSMIFDYCTGNNVNEASCFVGADGILTFGWTSIYCTYECVDGACIRLNDIS